MASALEQSMIDLCAKHDLSSVSLGVHPAHQPNAGFTVYLHWVPSSCCAAGTAGTIADALRTAIGDMIAKRTPEADHGEIADEALPETENIA